MIPPHIAGACAIKVRNSVDTHVSNAVWVSLDEAEEDCMGLDSACDLATSNAVEDALAKALYGKR